MYYCTASFEIQYWTYVQIRTQVESSVKVNCEVRESFFQVDSLIVIDKYLLYIHLYIRIVI